MRKLVNTFTKANTLPENWDDDLTLTGKLYRFVETGVDLPLIEISEGDLPKLDGYEFYEPYWVVAQPPVLYAIYDRHERLIFGPQGLAEDYSLERLFRESGYDSREEFQADHSPSKSAGPLTDEEIWIRMGLPARVYLPSLKRKPLGN